jgi:hypothetical protein
LNPETRLLVLLSRLRLDAPAEGERDRLLAGGALEWTSLLRSAVAEGVAPLLHRHLKSDERVPPEARLALRRAHFSSLTRQLRFEDALRPLLLGAREARLSVVVTKGVYWSEHLYGEPGLRPFLDADLLVAPREWPAFRSLLRRSGFAVEGAAPEDRASAPPRAAWLVSPVYKKAGDLGVEIHLNPLGLHAPLREPAAFWAAARGVFVCGAPASALPWEYELVHAAIHAQQHSYERLSWLVDMAEMIRTKSPDWSVVGGLSRREGLDAAVGHGLRLVERFWPGTVPAAALRPLSVRPYERRGLRSLWPEDDIVSRRPRPAAPFYMPSVFALIRRGRPLAAVLALRPVFFPPWSWVSHYYPGTPVWRRWGHYARRVISPAVFLIKRRIDGSRERGADSAPSCSFDGDSDSMGAA